MRRCRRYRCESVGYWIRKHVSRLSRHLADLGASLSDFAERPTAGSWFDLSYSKAIRRVSPRNSAENSIAGFAAGSRAYSPSEFAPGFVVPSRPDSGTIAAVVHG